MKIFSSIGKWFVRQWHNEPLRSTTYTISAAVLAYLLATGLVTQSLESLILTVIGVVLVGGGTEAARTQVAPVEKLTEGVTKALGTSAPAGSVIQRVLAVLPSLLPKR